MRSNGIGVLAVLVAIAGCGPEGTPGIETGRNESASTESEVSTFYSTRPDTRRCMAPLCGGFWVKRVNRPYTLCSDGYYRSECYVFEVQNSTGLSDAEWQAARGKTNIVRADMLKQTVGSYTVGALRASEVWTAFDGQTAAGDFYQITDKQIRCFAYPCFSLHEDRLNSASHRDLSGIEGRLGFEAGEALAKGKIIVVGYNQSRTGGGKVVLVNQLYTKAEQHSTICAEYTTSDGRFYAKNFPSGDEAEAQAWIAAEPQVVSSGYGIGTCVAMNEKPCDPQDPPVCGLPVETNVAGNYASLCEYRKVVREFAGTVGESKGKFLEGACQPYCAVATFTENDTSFVYVQTFLWLELADEWLASTFPNADHRVETGSCGAQPQCVVAMYAPVCGTVRDLAPVTYDAPCLFANAVMKDAGDNGSKGYYTKGECPAQSGWITALDVTIASLAYDDRAVYDFAAPPAATSVEITTSGGTGDADLYVRTTVAPTEYSFDCRSWNYGNEEACTFTSTPGGYNYKIMVLGYEASTDIHLVARYYIP